VSVCEDVSVYVCVCVFIGKLRKPNSWSHQNDKRSLRKRQRLNASEPSLVCNDCISNYYYYIITNTAATTTFSFFLSTAWALRRQNGLNRWLADVFVKPISQELQVAWISKFACKQHVVKVDAHVIFGIIFLNSKNLIFFCARECWGSKYGLREFTVFTKWQRV